MSTRNPSPASCSSRCRVKAASWTCRSTFPRDCRSSASGTASSTWTTRCRPEWDVRDPSGRSSTTAWSPICSCPASRSAAAFRWRPSQDRRRSSTPCQRAASVGPSAGTRSLALRRSPSWTRSRARISGAAPTSLASESARASRRLRGASTPSARSGGSARCWRSNSWRTTGRRRRPARWRAPRLRPPARAGSSSFRAASTATSSEFSSRSSYPTRISTEASSSWRKRLSTQARERPSEAGEGAPQPAADVRLEGVRKSFGDVVAVDGVDLEIDQGEFFSLLGPSGSGKTTLLRIIAGFERPDSGRVHLRGIDVTSRPPYARQVNTVFQDYALFPHMSVQQNVEYGLRVKKVPKTERRQKASDALDMVRLQGYGDRRPAQLSGGQRQRVALARAIVNRPQALLLDEPLGALDLKLRQELQIELKQIQQELGMTFVYVTHDQEEALTMSDRIAVFNQGRIEQVGTPAEMYEHPRTEFVAGFIGTSNIIERDGRTFTVRPEKIRLSTDEAAEGEPGVITAAVYLGPVTKFIVALDGGGELTVVQQNLETSSEDVRGMERKRVRLRWSPDVEFVIEPESV